MKTSLCAIEVSVAGFLQDLAHADQISDFLATSVSLDQSDTLRHSNTLSIIINEVAETLKGSNQPDSTAAIELITEGDAFHVNLHVNAADDVVAFYERIIGTEGRSRNLERVYREALLSNVLRPELGVLRLMTDYRANIVVTRKDASRATIEVSVSVKDLMEVPR